MVRYATPIFRRCGRSLICGALLLVACTTCSPRQPPDLCACVEADANGRWDMHLSDACIARFVEEFGQELEGLEEWFRQNCNDYEVKPQERPPARAGLIPRLP